MYRATQRYYRASASPQSGEGRQLRPYAGFAAALAIAVGAAAIVAAGLSLAARIHKSPGMVQAQAGMLMGAYEAFERSAALARRIAPDINQPVGEIELVVVAGRAGRRVRRWEFDSTDRAGASAAHVEWDADTGELVALSRCQTGSASAGSIVRRAGAAFLARAWLGAVQEGERRSARRCWRMAKLPSRNGGTWSVRLTDGLERLDVVIDASTGAFSRCWRSGHESGTLGNHRIDRVERRIDGRSAFRREFFHWA